MSKELIKKEENQCHLCARISSSKSVLRESKDKKTGVITYHCTNSKKCKAEQKKGQPAGYLKFLNSRRTKKKATEKKAVPAAKKEVKKK